MRGMPAVIAAALGLGLLFGAAPTAHGQLALLDEGRWQLAPTLAVVRQGSSVALSGFDDNCGGPERSPVYGAGVVGADGRVSIGVTIVGGAPGARPGHYRIRLDSTLSGTWTDEAGHAGPVLVVPR